MNDLGEEIILSSEEVMEDISRGLADQAHGSMFSMHALIFQLPEIDRMKF